jgi:hypothetical protein
VFRQTFGFQEDRLDLATKTHGRLEKVNAKKKFGVAVFFFGVLAETKNGLKNG